LRAGLDPEISASLGAVAESGLEEGAFDPASDINMNASNPAMSASTNALIAVIDDQAHGTGSLFAVRNTARALAEQAKKAKPAAMPNLARTAQAIAAYIDAHGEAPNDAVYSLQQAARQDIPPVPNFVPASPAAAPAA
jgi:hypothetical protein